MRLVVGLVGSFLLAPVGAALASARDGDRGALATPGPGAAPQDTTRRPRADSARVDSLRADSLRRAAGRADSIPLDLRLVSRLEAKAERVRNARCAAQPGFGTAFGCGGPFQPLFDFQVNLRSKGSIADRLHIDVDYDTQREFDASNAISLSYEGKSSSLLQRVEVGNVSFAPPPSRFLTGGIPSGNYGIQALGHVGPMRFAAIAAQQKGNVVQDRVFLIGDRTRQTVDRAIEDHQIEPRRFFWTVDPRLFGARYPNIDILDVAEMRALAASLPDTVRPSRVLLYRLLLGGQPPNPNGPRFVVRREGGLATGLAGGAFGRAAVGSPESGFARAGPAGRTGELPLDATLGTLPGAGASRSAIVEAARSSPSQPYELLREGIDYYIDPSNLWVALVRPLNLTNERLVVAYTVRVNGRDVVIPGVGGTPDVEFVPGREQVADLVWDPQVVPDDPAFLREIRSVYRVAGEELKAGSLEVRIVTGASEDQEKPPGTSYETYLQLFGLAERTNASRFDVANRLWPRLGDPNVRTAGGVGGGNLGDALIRDRFLVFPSLEPFARRGLARDPAVPANDSIYHTPNEYLYAPQHPQTTYRIRLRYESEAGDNGSIALNAVQVRPGSERVLVDGRPLRRGIDYEVDYEVGRLTFRRPDSLFSQPRRVVVRYEETPLFQSVPTTIAGLTTRFTTDAGEVDFTAISQTQRTTFTRPPLGYEPQSSLVAGVRASFQWDAWALSRGLSRALAWRRDSVGPSRISLDGEFAVSRPQIGVKQQAFLESFEGEGGVLVNTSETVWYYSSQPMMTAALSRLAGSAAVDLPRASTMAWQNVGTDAAGRPIVFSIDQIDPQTDLVGTAFSGPEPMLWLTLYPLAVGGRYDPAAKRYDWLVPGASPGRRWRSVRTPLGTANQGADLTRVETIDFWTLVDTSTTRRATNPMLVLDLGDISENSVAFSPDTLLVGPAVASRESGLASLAALPGRGRLPAPDPRQSASRDATRRAADSLFTGKRFQGLDHLDSERDPFSRAFDVATNDRGLPGDVADRISVVGGGTPRVDSMRVCTRGELRLLSLGDSRADCTVGNNRLDEEDLDGDGVLNLTTAERDQERIRRYIVDLSDPRRIERIGRCGVRVDDVNGALGGSPSLCWAHVRVPFARPDDSTNGGPLLRKVRALRVTMLSGRGASDDAFATLPLARLRLTGAPWIKRTERPARGIGGVVEATRGFVVASVIGTQDSTRTLEYQSPPGVAELPETRAQEVGTQRVQVNERSLRLLAGGLARYDRAEAYYRFPEGERSFMGYRELRAWARGRGRGWGGGQGGELEFYVKIGRDANNFYLYRTGANSGSTRAAWEPEVRVRFDRFHALRAQLQRAYLHGGAADSLACRGADSALVARSGLPLGTATHRFAACSGGYMVYTIDPTVSPPNLAAVQELAVGIVRVDSLVGPAPLAPGDTAEVWVDDIRLADATSQTGMAGQIGASLEMGDLGSVRVNLVRRDPNFRQLGEQPSFQTSNDLEVAASWRLDRLLPARLGVALPLTITHLASGADPEFLTRSDIPAEEIQGLRAPRTSLTTYSLTVRRAAPLDGRWWAPLVNNLAASGAYTAQGRRSEYQTGAARRFSFGVDWVGNGLGDRGFGALGGSAPDDSPLPGADTTRTMTPAPLRRLLEWVTDFRLSSAFAGDDDRRASYLEPAASLGDSARVARGLSRVWRSGSALELRPSPMVGVRLDVVSLRDLRNYGDTSAQALAARSERDRLAGLDVGLEREREMRLGVTVAPRVTSWLVPRLDLATSSSMFRDPNAPPSPVMDSIVGIHRLPRRLANQQTLTAALTLDLVRAAREGAGGDSTRFGALARAIRPIDVSWTRGLLGAFDATAASPGLVWQLGLASPVGFRSVDGRLASSAGTSGQLVLAQTFLLPAGISITHRAQRIDSRTWERRLDLGLHPVDGTQIVWPDVALQWVGRPAQLAGLVTSVALNARWLETRQGTRIPATLAGVLDERRATLVRSWPLSGTVAWAPGGVSTTAAYTLTRRADSLPGSLGTTDSHDASADIARAFKLPESWGLRSALRTRLGWQETRTASFVSNLAAVGLRSRLTDNGRRAVTANASTDLSDNLTFSLQGSRVVSFDRNFNRKIVQTVFSTALQLQFFGGAMK